MTAPEVKEEHRHLAAVAHAHSFDQETLRRWAISGRNAPSISLTVTARLIAEAEVRGAERMREAAANLVLDVDPTNGALRVIANRIRRLKVTP